MYFTKIIKINPSAMSVRKFILKLIHSVERIDICGVHEKTGANMGRKTCGRAAWQRGRVAGW